MGRIESARAAVLQWSRSVLALRGRALDGPPGPDAPSDDEADTIFDVTGLVMTPAQPAGFFARSSSWRCTGCGKVHMFSHVVRSSPRRRAPAPASSSSRASRSTSPGAPASTDAADDLTSLAGNRCRRQLRRSIFPGRVGVKSLAAVGGDAGGLAVERASKT